MSAEAQRQLEQLLVDVRATVAEAHPGVVSQQVILYRDRAPGLFADRPTTGRELVLAMLTERARRGTLTVLDVSADQATFEVRLRCGLVVCITPSNMPLAIGGMRLDTE
jgi:hypothetical protein